METRAEHWAIAVCLALMGTAACSWAVPVQPPEPTVVTVQIRGRYGDDVVARLVAGDWWAEGAFDEVGAPFFHYRRGRRLRVEQRGPRVFVGVDGGPMELNAVLVDEKGGRGALRGLLEAGHGPLAIVCSTTTLATLPPLPMDRPLALALTDERPVDLRPLARLGNLTSLWLPWQCVHDLSPLARLTRLTSLRVACLVRNVDLAPLAALRHLQSLRLQSSHVRDLAPLAQLWGLVNLDLASCRDVSDLRPLARLTRLVGLSLQDCNDVTDISPLSGLRRLRHLDLSGCTVLRSLRPLSRCTSLRALDVSACGEVDDLSPLAALVELTDLAMWDCGAQDVAFLGKLTKL